MGRSMRGDLVCLDCAWFKTRVFRSITALNEWCDQKAIKVRAEWLESVCDHGEVRLMWCTEQNEAHRSHGFSPRNAAPEYATNWSKYRQESKRSVVITNPDKTPFIRNCPYYEGM